MYRTAIALVFAGLGLTTTAFADDFASNTYMAEDHQASIAGWQESVEQVIISLSEAQRAGDQEAASKLAAHLRQGEKVLYSLRHYNPYTGQVEPENMVRFTDEGVVVEPATGFASNDEMTELSPKS